MNTKRYVFAATVVLVSVGLVGFAEAQTCEGPQALVDRLYVRLSDPSALPSLQLYVTIGKREPAKMDYDDGNKRWYVNLVPPFFDRVPLGDMAPGGPAIVNVTKPAWTFSRSGEAVLGRVERDSSGSRCVTELGFYPYPAWLLRVVAEPQARRVKMRCETCPRDAETDFTTGWTREQLLRLEAHFLERLDPVVGQVSCASVLRVRDYHVITRFSYQDVVRNLPRECRAFRVLGRIQHLVPDFISVSPARQGPDSK